MKFQHTLMGMVLALFSCTNDVEVLPEIETGWSKVSAISDEVLSIYKASDERIWVGTATQGVYVYDGSNFTNYRTSQGLINNTVNAISEFSNGDMWFGTSGGLSVYDGSWTNYDQVNGSPFEVYSLLNDGQGNMWINSWGMGLFSYDENDELLWYWDANCDWCNYINTLFQDGQGNLWIGTYAGLKKRANNSFTLYTITDGLPDNVVTSVYEDSWGRMWIGTYNGEKIGMMENNKFSSMSLQSGYPVNSIMAISEDIMGNMWFGAIDYFPDTQEFNNSGIIKYDGATMRTLVDEGPGRTNTLAFLEEGNGTVWVGTAKGLYKYKY